MKFYTFKWYEKQGSLQKYLAVQTKDEYMDIFNLHDKQVQEIYLSEDFEPRVKGTGYRG